MKISKGPVSAIALSLLLAAGAASAESKKGGFPAAGIDAISHEITVDLYALGNGVDNYRLLETLVFKGRMIIEREDPHLNAATGKRQIDFVVQRWEAQAWSNALNGLVVYRLSNVPQKTSTVTAEKAGSDYPARFSFNVTFDASINSQDIIIEHEGAPDGPSFMEVPPSGNRRTSPRMTNFETIRIEADHPVHGRIRFVPTACEDEGGDTLVTFTEEQKRLLKSGVKPTANTGTR